VEEEDMDSKAKDYEAPEVEDAGAEEVPAVTAAGGTGTDLNPE
jgi:hypothetical protein